MIGETILVIPVILHGTTPPIHPVVITPILQPIPQQIPTTDPSTQPSTEPSTQPTTEPATDNTPPDNSDNGTYDWTTDFPAEPPIDNTPVFGSTSLSLTVYSSHINIGDTLLLQASVNYSTPNGDTPDGTVTFYDNNHTLGTSSLDNNLNATLSTNALTTGIHKISASFSADNDFTDSSSSSVQVTVMGHTIAAATQPPTIIAGNALGTPLVLNIDDANGHVIAGDNGNITLAITSAPPGVATGTAQNRQSRQASPLLICP